MPRSTLLAVLLLAALPVAAQQRAGTGAAPGDRAAAFDRLFEQLESHSIRPATPEENKANIARLHALLPPGDSRRELKARFVACVQAPEDAQASLAFARRGLADARIRGDIDAQARFLYCQAGFEERVGKPREAITHYSQGITLARRVEQPRLVGDGLVLRGNVYSFLGEHALALVDFIAAQRIYDAARLQERSDANLQNIGIAYRRMGEYDKARQYLQQGMETMLRQQNWDGLLVQWLQLGFLHEDMGQADRALAAYAEALKVARQRLEPGETAPVHLAMASAHVLREDYPAALRALDSARAEFARTNETSDAGMMALLEGQARAGLGEVQPAIALFDRAEAVLKADGNERYLAMLYPERARLHEKQGDTRRALADYKRYLALREKLLDARADQRTLMLRQQFDATRRDLENQRLRNEKALREQEVRALLTARRWQRGAIVLGLLLIGVLGALILRQLVRTRRLHVLALTDELTGVANRRRIELICEEAIARAREQQQPLSLVTLDIDYFKRINDSHGHIAGDQVITRVAHACQRALRQFDEIGRTGGEEFLVVLPDTAPDAAAHIAERLRASVEALRWDDVAPGLRVTISLGLSSLQPGDSGLKDILGRADSALYQAKGAGRNRAEMA